MAEKQVFFQSGVFCLEGAYSNNDSEKAAVISSPHPQMGGSMWNNVVETIASAFYRKGYATLRFNFRGVGNSDGSYDEGRGEQEDLAAAVSYLKRENKKEVTLAGYSFGAWVTVNLLSRYNACSDVVLVSPPINLLKFNFSGLTGKIGLIISGEYDEFSSPEDLKKISRDIDCRLEIIRGADHFYFGSEYGIIRILDKYLD